MGHSLSRLARGARRGCTGRRSLAEARHLPDVARILPRYDNTLSEWIDPLPKMIAEIRKIDLYDFL